MIWRRFTLRCVYCGSKKCHYDIWFDPEGALFGCPTDMYLDMDMYTNMDTSNSCSHKKKFIGHKEANVQRALGLLSRPKGF